MYFNDFIVNNEKLTIKDIAELAQVSKGTVSKALNDQPGVGKKTKDRILKLVQKLDFHPNSAAQALASNKTENIGLFIPHISYNAISGSYWAAMISGIVEKANAMGYNVLLFTIEKDGDLFSAYNLLLKRKRVDGFIVSSELLDKKSLKSLYMSNIPFVLLGQSLILQHYYVDVDNFKAAYEMTTYMIKKGYKRVAFLSGSDTLSYNKSRIDGYKAAIADSDTDFCVFRTSAYCRDEAFKNIDEIMKEKPDSLFIGAGGDFIFDTIDKFNEMNIKVPEFGLSTFDDYLFMDYITPHISTISQPFEKLGFSAVEMLCQIIEKGEPDKFQIIHEAKIITRESCGEKKI